MFNALFELLFKYRPLAFEQGDFVLGSPWSLVLVVLVLGLGAAVTLTTYAQVRGKTRPLDRWVLSGLRLAALAVVVFCLFRPMLVLSSVVPQQNFLGILIDDSRSMEIADRDDAPRRAFVDRSFGSKESTLRAALADRFALRFFRFSSATERLNDLGDLGYAGSRTDLGQALGRVRDELAGVPLSGIVVVSDGADNSESGLTDSLRALGADGVPVYTVGLGREAFERDIQVSRVEAPRSVLLDTTLVVDVVIGQVGYAGTTIAVQVEDEGRIVNTEEVELPANGEPATVRMRFTATEAGPRILRFSVPPQPGEMVAQNNVRDVLVVVEDRREKILYFEGEPRFEVKFIRRAVADDDNLQLVVLQRTADNKYLRLDIDDADDLVGGFPKTREELFEYRGLMLGSVEASYFTPDQLRMIADFVNQRGGGFLMLGRTKRVRRRRLCRHAGGQHPAGHDRRTGAGRRRTGVHRAGRHPDAGGRDPRGDAGRRHGGGVGRALAVAAGHLEPQPDHRYQAGCHDAPDWHGCRRVDRAHRPRLPAIRRGQDAGPADPGLLDVADARRHRAGRHDA